MNSAGNFTIKEKAQALEWLGNIPILDKTTPQETAFANTLMLEIIDMHNEITRLRILLGIEVVK